METKFLKAKKNVEIINEKTKLLLEDVRDNLIYLTNDENFDNFTIEQREELDKILIFNNLDDYLEKYLEK